MAAYEASLHPDDGGSYVDGAIIGDQMRPSLDRLGGVRLRQDRQLDAVLHQRLIPYRDGLHLGLRRAVEDARVGVGVREPLGVEERLVLLVERVIRGPRLVEHARDLLAPPGVLGHPLLHCDAIDLLQRHVSLPFRRSAAFARGGPVRPFDTKGLPAR